MNILIEIASMFMNFAAAIRINYVTGFWDKFCAACGRVCNHIHIPMCGVGAAGLIPGLLPICLYVLTPFSVSLYYQ